MVVQPYKEKLLTNSPTERQYPGPFLIHDITGFETRLTRRVPLVEQELIPEFIPGICGVRDARSLVLCACFVDRCLSFCTFYAPATKSRGGGDILIYPCPSVRPSGQRYMVCPAISSYSFGATALIFCMMFIHIMEVDLFIISYGQAQFLTDTLHFFKNHSPQNNFVHNYQVRGHTSILVSSGHCVI